MKRFSLIVEFVKDLGIWCCFAAFAVLGIPIAIFNTECYRSISEKFCATLLERLKKDMYDCDTHKLELSLKKLKGES